MNYGIKITISLVEVLWRFSAVHFLNMNRFAWNFEENSSKESSIEKIFENFFSYLWLKISIHHQKTHFCLRFLANSPCMLLCWEHNINLMSAAASLRYKSSGIWKMVLVMLTLEDLGQLRFIDIDLQLQETLQEKGMKSLSPTWRPMCGT